MTEPLRVLFVCTANICRSPHMELTARALAGDSRSVAFSSAGTQGFSAHPMDEEMARTLPTEVAHGEFRSRPLDKAILDGVDLVLTAESSHRARILEEHPALLRKVFSLGQFAAAVPNHPGLRGRELVQAMGMRRTPALVEHDVDDPYRRGTEAAQATAGTISTMLSVIVPALVDH